MRSLSGFLMAAIMTACAGCHVAGPTSVKAGRADYNVAVQQTNNEQLLLNLVRLRYRDPPYFLEVSSISTTFDFSGSASGSVTLPPVVGDTYGVGTGIGYSEQPTISYAPLQGEDFVSALMSPMDLNTLILLYNSGWSVERIFRICVQSLNGVPNAPTASGPTPDTAPAYERFREVMRELRQMQIKGVMDIGQIPSNDPSRPGVQIRFAENARDSAEAKRICELLDLNSGRTDYPLVIGTGDGGKDRITTVIRSLMGSLFYLSQSVQVPEKDEKMGRVTVTRDAQGQRFNWGDVVGGLLSIHASELPPQNAYAAVQYRGSWFYISDSDLPSKSTFSLLMQLFALQAGEIKSAGPLLTLPVGGN